MALRGLPPTAGYFYEAKIHSYEAQDLNGVHSQLF